MRCRRAGRMIVERELGLPLRAPDACALQRHLSACPECARRAVAEARLVVELGSLRAESVSVSPPLDVTARVMREVGSGSSAHVEERSRGLGWATAAACAVGLFLALTLLAAVPAVPAVARASAASLGAAWERVTPALVAVIALPFRLIGPLLELASGIGSLIGKLEPLAYTVSLAACLAMLATIAVVVSRDLALGRTVAPRKER